MGGSPAATKPHPSPQEHRVLTNPHSARSTGCPGLGGVPGIPAGTGSCCGCSPRPEVQVPPDDGRGPSEMRGGATTWAPPGRGESAPRLRGRPAFCCPCPGSGRGHLALPRQAQGAAPSAGAGHMSPVDTVKRWTAASRRPPTGATCRSSPPDVKKRRSAWARGAPPGPAPGFWQRRARSLCPFPASVPEPPQREARASPPRR